MNFESSLAVVLEIEGGLVDNPSDPGGLTNFGISQRSYPHLDIRNLTRDQAAAIYRSDFWDACRCEELPDPLRLPVFDCAVNQGVPRAITLLQKLLGVAQDGAIGPRTLRAARYFEDKGIARVYLAERVLAYASSPNWDVFGRGWTLRVLKVAMAG